MNRDIRKKAWKKVKAIKRFYYHLSAYAIMGAFFFFMNMVTDPFDMWFYFPMIPWSALVAFHYLAVFGIPGSRVLTREWEEREFERQIEKMEDRYDYEPRSLKGGYLEYTEMSDEEALELRRLQKEDKGKDSSYFGEDFV